MYDEWHLLTINNCPMWPNNLRDKRKIISKLFTSKVFLFELVALILGVYLHMILVHT